MGLGHQTSAIRAHSSMRLWMLVLFQDFVGIS